MENCKNIFIIYYIDIAIDSLIITHKIYDH